MNDKEIEKKCKTVKNPFPEQVSKVLSYITEFIQDLPEYFLKSFKKAKKKMPNKGLSFYTKSYNVIKGAYYL